MNKVIHKGIVYNLEPPKGKEVIGHLILEIKDNPDTGIRDKSIKFSIERNLMGEIMHDWYIITNLSPIKCFGGIWMFVQTAPICELYDSEENIISDMARWSYEGIISFRDNCVIVREAADLYQIIEPH